MSTTKDQYQEKMNKTLSVLKTDLNTVRAGRANPALLDQVSVEYYGTPTPLKQLCNIQVPDPRTIMVIPFDPKSLGLIEKSIQAANIGINPTNDGKNIRLVIPPLTEERRVDLTKQIKKMGEESKVAVRNLRRDVNDSVKRDEKAGLLTEDDVKKELDDVQKLTDKCIKDIDDIIANKAKELMEL